MSTNRRTFIERLAGGAALFGAAPFLDATSLRAMERSAAGPAADSWDLDWVKRLNTKHRVVLDVPEIDNGYGVWRSSFWMNQYKDVMNANDKDMTSVVVLRHNGIALAMKQAFWDEYGIGKAKNAMHPLTLQPTDRNPALLGESDGVPQPFANFALDKFLQRGGIALGCNLAFGDCVELVKTKHKLDDEGARKKALEGLQTGVILQPSGVFAVIRAQQAGAVYIRAS